MPTITVDKTLSERMEIHPEINWSVVTRQTNREKIEALDVMNEIGSGSDLTESDIWEIGEGKSRKRPMLLKTSRSRFDE